MHDIFIDLPFPPTVNSYYVKTQRGVYISKKGRLFREAVSDACNEHNLYGMKLDMRLQMDVIFYPPDARKRDLDNYMKALQDALTIAEVWGDDEQVDGVSIHRGRKVQSGACKVRIAEHHGMLMPHADAVWDFIE